MSEARKLLEQALHLMRNGERAPGCGPWPDETWGEWASRAEAYLRNTSEVRIGVSEPPVRIVPVPVYPEGWLPR